MASSMSDPAYDMSSLQLSPPLTPLAHSSASLALASPANSVEAMSDAPMLELPAARSRASRMSIDQTGATPSTAATAASAASSSSAATAAAARAKSPRSPADKPRRSPARKTAVISSRATSQLLQAMSLSSNGPSPESSPLQASRRLGSDYEMTPARELRELPPLDSPASASASSAPSAGDSSASSSSAVATHSAAMHAPPPPPLYAHAQFPPGMWSFHPQQQQPQTPPQQHPSAQRRDQGGSLRCLQCCGSHCACLNRRLGIGVGVQCALRAVQHVACVA